MENHNLAYRPDIDGLRAIAVIAVVLSHAFPDFLPGGFVGVDIFFVISGFLITTILVKEMETQRFSVAAFYGRRIRRLFPALTLVMACCLIAGYCLLLEDEYRQLGWHAAAGAGFVANIALWAETGYFERAADLKPLLHLWSLGVEEQFYVLWPLLVALTMKARNRLQTLAIGLLILSFSINLITSHSDPNTAFFLPHTRFWELLSGAVLAIAMKAVQSPPKYESTTKKRFASEVIAVFGIALIFLSLVITKPSDAFPGWLALLPSIGAASLIAAGPRTWIANRLLSLRLLVWIGLISYPLYLWHWPLLSFSRIVLGEQPSTWTRFLAVGIAIVLATATYRLIELPLRGGTVHAQSRHRVTATLAATIGFLLLAGLMTHQRIPKERLHRISQEIKLAAKDWYYPGNNKAIFSGVSQETVLFFGDSFIQQYYPRIELLYRQSEPFKGVRFHALGGCAPLPGVIRRTQQYCRSFFEQGMAIAEDAKVTTVVIGASWIGMDVWKDYVDLSTPKEKALDLSNDDTRSDIWGRLEQKTRELIRKGKTVVLLLNPPGGPLASPESQYKARISPSAILQVKSIPIEEHYKRTGAINDQIRTLAKNTGAQIVDPAEWICSDDLCRFTDENGNPYFKDSTHFRASYIRWQLKAFDHLLANPESAT